MGLGSLRERRDWIRSRVRDDQPSGGGSGAPARGRERTRVCVVPSWTPFPCWLTIRRCQVTTPRRPARARLEGVDPRDHVDGVAEGDGVEELPVQDRRGTPGCRRAGRGWPGPRRWPGRAGRAPPALPNGPLPGQLVVDVERVEVARQSREGDDVGLGDGPTRALPLVADRQVVETQGGRDHVPRHGNVLGRPDSGGKTVVDSRSGDNMGKIAMSVGTNCASVSAANVVKISSRQRVRLGPASAD